MNHFPFKTARLLFFLTLLTCQTMPSIAQDKASNIIEGLSNARAGIPADKVFIHTNKNIYQPGDTIFFQTYIENRFNQELVTSSLSSWVVLLNEKNEFIDTARIRIGYATAPGWLVIPNNCKFGWYRLKAFTSQMQNYGPGFAFSSWVRVDELIKGGVVFNYRFNKGYYHPGDTVELTLEFKEQNGQQLKNTSFTYTVNEDKGEASYKAKTTRKGLSTIRVFLPVTLGGNSGNLDITLENGLGEYSVDIPFYDPEPHISFLPEGGTFTAGFPQKVAFNAVSKSGRQLFLKGCIKDNMGNFIDSLRPGRMGPGLVKFTPLQGRQYHAEFAGYPGVQWGLPEVTSSPCIQVTQPPGCVNVYVLGGEEGRVYHLAFIKNNNLVAFESLQGGSPKKAVFKTGPLPPGMAYATLFNDKLEPIAERVFFIPEKSTANCSINLQGSYTRAEQLVNLGIEIKTAGGDKKGIFSIAVVDSATALSPQVNLLSLKDCFLFDDDFYKRLPYYIKQFNLSGLPPAELDLLMLTYGWVRFDTEVEAPSEGLVNYDEYRITATELFSKKNKKINKSKEPFFVLPLGGTSLVGLQKGTGNNFFFNVDSVPAYTSEIMIVPNNTVKKKVQSVTLSPIINDGYFSSFKLNGEQKEVFKTAPLEIIKDPVFDLDSFRMVREIMVYEKRRATVKYLNEYDKRYQANATKTLGQDMIKLSHDFESLLMKLNPTKLDIAQKKIYFRLRGKSMGPALFVLDGTPIGSPDLKENNYKPLTYLSPKQIHSITVLRSVTGVYIYGDEAANGVVFVETKANHFGDKYELVEVKNYNQGDLGKVIELFRANKEFYNPPIEIIRSDPELWVRPTLYWNHEVFYDGENPVDIQYYNHRLDGVVYIIINGLTVDGELISTMHRYVVK